MTEIIFHNKNHLVKVKDGYQISSLEETNIITGVKIKVETNKNIKLNINIDVSTDAFLVGFINRDYKIINQIPKGKNFNKTYHINTKLFTHLGILYKTRCKSDKLLLRNFSYQLEESSNIDTINLNYFDQIYYINLEHRTNRKRNIVQQLKNLEFDFSIVYPIKAVYLPLRPQIGCALSHMKALQHAYINNYQRILILEDDFVFTINKTQFKEGLTQLDRDFPEWDLVQLASINEKSIETKNKYISKVIKADTTSAYMIKHKNITTIFNVFKTCLNPNPLYKGNKFAIDVAWQPIQSKMNWFIFKPHLGKQNEEFPSDIERFRSYNWIS